MEKKCSKCGQVKSLDCFGKAKSHSGGINPWCKECCKASSKAHYDANKESRRAKSLEIYYRNFKDPKFRARRNARQAEYSKEYVKRPEVRERLGREYRERCKDIGFRVGRRMSFQVWFSLRKKLDGKGKAGRHWEDLVGWTVEQLMSHLESRFEPGMTWGNYGGKSGWQIDHVVPRTWFDISSPNCDGFRKCWELGNLQPKWLRDNARKGNRYSG